MKSKHILYHFFLVQWNDVVCRSFPLVSIYTKHLTARCAHTKFHIQANFSFSIHMIVIPCRFIWQAPRNKSMRSIARLGVLRVSHVDVCKESLSFLLYHTQSTNTHTCTHFPLDFRCQVYYGLSPFQCTQTEIYHDSIVHNLLNGLLFVCHMKIQ